MPELSYVKYNKAKIGLRPYIMYAKLTSMEITDNISHYAFCSCTHLCIRSINISSIFEKCNFSNSTFRSCRITKDAIFAGCNFTNTIFSNCFFETKEMYIFCKMVSKVEENCEVGEAL